MLSILEPSVAILKGFPMSSIVLRHRVQSLNILLGPGSLGFRRIGGRRATRKVYPVLLKILMVRAMLLGQY
jgi:hypothetical protein